MTRPLRRRLVLVLLPAIAWALAPPRFPGPQPRARPGANGVGDYEYETRYFRQRLDHFSFPGVGDEASASAFFQQRYLVGRGGGWAGPGGPIFFYCGNEGDIAWFAANSGLVWEAAPRFAALVVFAEHLYYGESMPFGSKAKAYNNSKSLAYLTAEQAIADFAVLLTDLKRNLSAEGSPLVLFGGSYDGMLAAWMRLKYPHIAVGALVSSAPILQFEHIVPSTIFYDLVSDDFRACTEMVMPMSYSEDWSMYPPYKFDNASYAEECIKSYGVRPRPRWITTEFGGHNITTVLEKFGSNIIFFNGLLDPWSHGGVLQNISESVIAIVAPLGAHHIDLRPATPEEPDWLVSLRESELKIISGWLSDYYGARGGHSSSLWLSRAPLHPKEGITLAQIQVSEIKGAPFASLQMPTTGHCRRCVMENEDLHVGQNVR